jgi:hypothetical protein
MECAREIITMHGKVCSEILNGRYYLTEDGIIVIKCMLNKYGEGRDWIYLVYNEKY